MGWEPHLREDEETEVYCSFEVRPQVRFDLMVADDRVCYSRRKAFAVSDPVVTETVPRRDIVSAAAWRRNPVLFWMAGLAAIGLGVAYAGLFLAGLVEEFHFHSLLLLGCGGALLASGRSRWRLVFRDSRGRKHTMVQPFCSSKKMTESMTRAIQTAGEVLSRGARRGTP